MNDSKHPLYQIAANLGAVILAYISPLMGIFVVLIFASLMDHFFGVWKAVKKKEKVSFWYGLYSSMLKVLMYGFVVLAVYILEKHLLNEFITEVFKLKTQFIGTKLTGLALFLLEGRSVNKHYKDVKGVGLFSALFEGLGHLRTAANEIGKIKSGIKILIPFLLISFSSCGVAKRATKHHNKAEQLGYIYSCKADTIISTVTIKGKDGKDSLIYVPVICDCPDVKIPETKTEIKWKFKYLIKKDKAQTKQVKAVEKTKTNITEEQTKQIKSKTKEIVKTAFPWEWFFGAIVAICVMLYLIFRKR